MERLFPPQGMDSLPSLSTLFCWVIGGVYQSLNSPEVPGSSVQEALQVAFCFSIYLQLAMEGIKYWDSALLLAWVLGT